jgi:hypothetical protein
MYNVPRHRYTACIQGGLCCVILQAKNPVHGGIPGEINTGQYYGYVPYDRNARQYTVGGAQQQTSYAGQYTEYDFRVDYQASNTGHFVDSTLPNTGYYTDQSFNFSLPYSEMYSNEYQYE